MSVKLESPDKPSGGIRSVSVFGGYRLSVRPPGLRSLGSVGRGNRSAHRCRSFHARFGGCGINENQLKSLILAQIERWRHG
jgi:hypothetical protein